MVEDRADPALEWLDHVRPVGLVVAPAVLREFGLVAERQTQADSAAAEELLNPGEGAALADPWPFFAGVLGWRAEAVAGAPGGPALPAELAVAVPEHGTVLAPHWAVRAAGTAGGWQLLVRIEAPDIDPDRRGAEGGWEASAHQRFERLLRETGVFAGVLIAAREIRLVYAPRGETSGWLAWPIPPLATVHGRPMLGGFKLLLGAFRLFNDAEPRRLPALLKRSREAQAEVSTRLAEQVLGALHELLRGFSAAEPDLVGRLARERPAHLYEGLLTVLMRLVFVLYAEDRDLIPSRTDSAARALYDENYSVRGLFARLTEDAALNPDTMDERVGGWGRLLALFRLVHGGERSGWIQGRGGKLFDPDAFPFLEGRAAAADPPRVVKLADGCLLRLLRGLMTIEDKKTKVRERLSYRALDVEQIGSVYETVMGFTVEAARGPSLAIEAGKNNRTPVFVDLVRLAAAKPGERPRLLKDKYDRRTLAAKTEAALKAATAVEDCAAALDSVVDERGSPARRIAPPGTPVLQPTDERRRTGSHYTPRSLTEPIVRHALAPAFERLGADAQPEDVLDLKICDPAMGSGAFLVEACRALAQRLVRAWARWPERRPRIPPDEDEELHARRLIAQRCLYGVDRNPMATDLAKLSLWLATLARDHEFTFLDHALKSGDSLVGLTRAQMAAAHWDAAQPGLPILKAVMKDRFAEAERGRREIREAPDDVARALQEARHKAVESRLDQARRIGDAIVSVFFGWDKPKAREAGRREIESWLASARPDAMARIETAAATLRAGPHPVSPFHWEIEFPEVFARENPGFDAIVGNPPFAGKNSVIGGNRAGYLPWLQSLHEGAHGNADLVAHFFRRAFALLRQGGAFGLIATNTIAQGDTRQSGLAPILKSGGAIFRCVKRLQWPGEAAVVVSVVHVKRGAVSAAWLDDRPVSRLSAFLVEGDLDESPATLAANAGKAFVGSFLLGMGFTFDDVNAAKGKCSSLADMHRLIAANPRNQERIFPYIGGEEINNHPRHAHHRYAIDFFDRPLRRDTQIPSWNSLSEHQRREHIAQGTVPIDYPDEVAEDHPDLIDIVRRLVKPERDGQSRDAVRKRWWQYAEKRPGLYRAIFGREQVLAVNCGATPHLAVAQLPTNTVFAHTLVVIAFSEISRFAILQSRPHEVWARFFASSMKDDLRYTPTDCFATFPFPRDFETDAALEAAGRAYHDHRAALMIARNEGMTPTYNRFHDRADTAADIARLRVLHAEMDAAVLRAYGWSDLAARAVPDFLDPASEPDHKYRGRLFWPADVRDEVLARLLALNAERHAEEVAAGVAPKAARGAAETNEAEGDEER